ncbi:KRAB [Mytilus coruscus]|uniref:KRAB n=1 Tax=Mytilus coruscus TaxID=42192 RepID=A0A6J8DGP2_MYTCO|nr:KRAB [Mytilus coruscus]
MGKTTDGETSRKKETKETDTGTRKSQRLRLKPVLQGHTKTIKEKKNLKNRNKNLKSLQVYLKDKKKEKRTVSNINMIEKKANCDTTTKSNKGDVKIKSDTTFKICHLNLQTEHKFHYHMKTQHRETSQNRKKELKSIQGSLKYKKIEKKPVIKRKPVKIKANNYTTRAIMKDIKIKSEVEIKTQNDNLDESSLDSTKSVKCKLCQKGYKNQSGLTQHMRFTHKTYCIHCEENLSSINELKEHLNKTHNIFAFEDGSLKYGSKICGKTFANVHKLNMLKAHQYVHDIHPPLKCKICHQTLKTENTLSYHMKTKHDETYQKNVSCEYCGKLFWCKSELDKHLRVHINERPYLCHICSSSFKTTGNLRNHQRAIHENHFWICDVCGQKFKSKPRFQEHLYKEKHGKDGKPIQYKEFPCNECGKIFPQGKKRWYCEWRINKDGSVNGGCGIVNNVDKEIQQLIFRVSLNFKNVISCVETRPQGQQTAGVQQVLESAGVQQVLESAGEQQVLESASIQHCFENTTNVEKIDQEGFEQQEVKYSTIYSLSEMKSVDNDI